MNEHDESEITIPPIISTPVSESAETKSSEPKPFSYWAKRFLVCNPFYLVSAALLLFGMYQISVDRNFFTGEISQLVFNLTSLEFYEILLVATAIFLAGRRIWYDSTLLVGLENLFIFVPFILVSQVALISTRAVWVVCAVTTVIAMARFGSLKRYFAELNLPGGVLAIGSALLAINIGLLATYRIVGETKMGWVPDSGRDFEINQLTWLVILPAALALANFLPHAGETGSLVPQRRWLPAGFFSLWIIATGVHLYCLNYVYNFAFNVGMLVPAFWMLAWTAYRRAPEILALEPRAPQTALAVSALLIPLAAASENGTKIFCALTALNVAIYVAMYFFDHNRRLARHLAFAAVVMLVCGLPSEWMDILTPGLDRGNYIGVGVAVYLMLYLGVSRNPRTGILGSIALTMGLLIFFQDHSGVFHWAVQAGLVFLLLHSLRWDDAKHEGARTVRATTAGLWVTHAFVWMCVGGEMWMPCATAAVVLGIYFAVRLLRGRWDLIILPAASVLTVLSGPGNALVRSLSAAPAGLLAVMGSFLLFAFGTGAALTKHRWHQSHPNC
jgi:hypothetical protein